MCRFHIRYLTYGPYSTEPWQASDCWPGKSLTDEEKEEWDSVWYDQELRLNERIEDGGEDIPATFSCNVETVKACNMLSSMAGRVQCEDCQPLVFRFEEQLEEDYYSDEMCHCGIFEHFSYRWRCIPCVLVEEAKLVNMQQKYKVTLQRNSRGEQRFSRVSCPSSTHRTILINSPDQILRLWKTGGKAQLGDVWAVWKNHRLAQWSQRENYGTHLCTAWNSARWPCRQPNSEPAGMRDDGLQVSACIDIARSKAGLEPMGRGRVSSACTSEVHMQ